MDRFSQRKVIEVKFRNNRQNCSYVQFIEAVPYLMSVYVQSTSKVLSSKYSFGSNHTPKHVYLFGNLYGFTFSVDCLDSLKIISHLIKNTYHTSLVWSFNNNPNIPKYPTRGDKKWVFLQSNDGGCPAYDDRWQKMGIFIEHENKTCLLQAAIHYYGHWIWYLALCIECMKGYR